MKIFDIDSEMLCVYIENLNIVIMILLAYNSTTVLWVHVCTRSSRISNDCLMTSGVPRPLFQSTEILQS